MTLLLLTQDTHTWIRSSPWISLKQAGGCTTFTNTFAQNDFSSLISKSNYSAGLQTCWPRRDTEKETRARTTVSTEITFVSCVELSIAGEPNRNGLADFPSHSTPQVRACLNCRIPFLPPNEGQRSSIRYKVLWEHVYKRPYETWPCDSKNSFNIWSPTLQLKAVPGAYCYA